MADERSRSRSPLMNEFLAHMLGDYVIQTDHMAARKTQAHGPAIAHALTYTLPFVAITRRWQPLLVIAGTHAVIDRYRLAKHVCWAKNQAAPVEWRPPHTATGYSPDKPDWMAVWLLIFADNTMHAVINRWALRRWAR